MGVDCDVTGDTTVGVGCGVIGGYVIGEQSSDRSASGESGDASDLIVPPNGSTLASRRVNDAKLAVLEAKLASLQPVIGGTTGGSSAVVGIVGGSNTVDRDVTDAYAIREQSSDRSDGASLQPGVGDTAVDPNAVAGIVESSNTAVGSAVVADEGGAVGVGQRAVGTNVDDGDTVGDDLRAGGGADEGDASGRSIAGGGAKQGRVLSPDGLQRAEQNASNVINELLVPALGPDGLSVDCCKNPCRLSRLISLGVLVILVLSVAPRVCWWCCMLSTLVLPLESLSWNSSELMTPLVLMLALLLEHLVSCWSSASVLALESSVYWWNGLSAIILTMTMAAHGSTIMDEH